MAMKPDLAALQKLLPDLALASGRIVPAGEHHRTAAVQVLDQVCSGPGPAWLWTAESPHIIHNAEKAFPGGSDAVVDRPFCKHCPLAGEQGPAQAGTDSLRLGQSRTGWTLWEQARVDDDAGVIVTWRMRGPGNLFLVYEVGHEMQPAGDLHELELRATEFRFLRFEHA